MNFKVGDKVVLKEKQPKKTYKEQDWYKAIKKIEPVTVCNIQRDILNEFGYVLEFKEKENVDELKYSMIDYNAFKLYQEKSVCICPLEQIMSQGCSCGGS